MSGAPPVCLNFHVKLSFPAVFSTFALENSGSTEQQTNQFQRHQLKVGSQYDAGTTSFASIVSVTGKTFSISEILFLMLNFQTIWLVGCWLYTGKSKMSPELAHYTLGYTQNLYGAYVI